MAPTLTDAPTKTANRRVVVLDAGTVEAIEALMLDRQDLGPWMLSDTGEPVNPDRIGAWWRRARKAAGIDPAWRLHDLRHWSATVAIASGHDVRTVAGRLGHANPAMTLRVYAHAVEAADEAVALRPHGGSRRTRRFTGMEIRYCTDAEAFYVTIGQGEIAGTAHISDDVMVDTEGDGRVHGIELLCTPAALAEEERAALVGRFPVAAEALAAIERLARLSA